MVPRTNETNLGNRNQNSGLPRFGGQKLWKRDIRQLLEEKETLYLDLVVVYLNVCGCQNSLTYVTM